MSLCRRTLPALLLALPAAALAQPAAPRRGPNGGPMVMADGHPIELVLSGTSLTIYLNESETRIAPSARAAGRVTIQSGGQTTTLTLAPAEPNRMVATLEAPLPPGTRLVFTGTKGDGHRITARFVAE